MNANEKELPEHEDSEASAGWLAAVGAVMDGRLAPEQGIRRLQALVSQYPDDAEWLRDEIETIRWTFGMDVEAVVDSQDSAYWDKVLAVAEGLLEERVTPSQALGLLLRVRERHPERAGDLQRLMDDIGQSPMWQIVDSSV